MSYIFHVNYKGMKNKFLEKFSAFWNCYDFWLYEFSLCVNGFDDEELVHLFRIYAQI